jgi:hypothetical protein
MMKDQRKTNMIAQDSRLRLPGRPGSATLSMRLTTIAALRLLLGD